ncbi:unnamed protein product [Adineta steineri]|uniref:Uncharacterized protein n=1 Tax=Adineta steineri TaxID=433720 RepID=A0A815EI09_9BILA|nr:unnamed protein product [Adineta steineri]CAF4043776.1 unnamed protein product [Adineta steineri]
MNINDKQFIDPNNRDQKQAGANFVVMHQPPPVATHTMTANIPNFYQPQPVLIYQNPNHPPMMMMNHGININPAMTPQIMAIPDYKSWSIFNICCCCFILGIFAYIKSGRTRDNKMCGNFQGALEASKSAKILNILATVTGSIVIITLIILAATKTITVYTYY